VRELEEGGGHTYTYVNLTFLRGEGTHLHLHTYKPAHTNMLNMRTHTHQHPHPQTQPTRTSSFTCAPDCTMTCSRLSICQRLSGAKRWIRVQILEVRSGLKSASDTARYSSNSRASMRMLPSLTRPYLWCAFNVCVNVWA